MPPRALGALTWPQTSRRPSLVVTTRSRLNRAACGSRSMPRTKARAVTMLSASLAVWSSGPNSAHAATAKRTRSTQIANALLRENALDTADNYSAAEPVSTREDRGPCDEPGLSASSPRLFSALKDAGSKVSRRASSTHTGMSSSRALTAPRSIRRGIMPPPVQAPERRTMSHSRIPSSVPQACSNWGQSLPSTTTPRLQGAFNFTQFWQ